MRDNEPLQRKVIKVKQATAPKSTEWADLEKRIGYTFVDKNLLKTAFTHTSAINELPEEERPTTLKHNERLEFLGDSVLELIITEELFLRYPDDREGTLTQNRSNLVREESLAKLARKIYLSSYLLLGKGSESQGIRELPSVLSDAFEALLAAMYLDAKKNPNYANPLEPAQNFLKKMYETMWPKPVTAKKEKDYKTLLQEATQAKFKDTPKYALINTQGAEHEKKFTIELILPNNVKIVETAKNKRTAEQEAAKKALHMLQEKK